MKSRRILYISQEIFPYLPESDISMTARKLSQGIQELGNDIRIFMPRFGLINERRNQLHEVIRLSGINMIINNNDHPLIIKVASLPAARMQVYFIDNDDFFKRKSLFDADPKAQTNDNDERSILFVVLLRRSRSSVGSQISSIAMGRSRRWVCCTSRNSTTTTLA